MDLYVVTDVETAGPVPGLYPMLSLGSVAVWENGQIVGTFTRNIRTTRQPIDPDTDAWWQKHPDAWAASRCNQVPTRRAFAEYDEWLSSLPSQPIFAAYPVTYDYMWVTSWLYRSVGRSPFGHAGLGIKTLARALYGLDYSASAHQAVADAGLGSLTHVALEDALHEAKLMLFLFDRLRDLPRLG